jgi:hypothetical protein
MNVADVCTRARDLILRDGFMTGGNGWHGAGGWCIEGALGAAMGLSCDDSRLSEKVNASPAGMAIRHHIGLYNGCALHGWNDRSGTTEGVLRVLAEVAAAYSAQPTLIEELVVEVSTYESPKIIVLPPMPKAYPTAKDWFKALVKV